MADQEGKYNIKAAALMLGIQPGTLRAWERRYQMIAPVRNEAGHRLYTDEHIKILKWLIKKINQGFTISQAISLLSNNQIQTDSESLNLKQGNPLNALCDELFEGLIHFEREKINEVINTMFSIFTVETVILEIFNQLLTKLENSFKSGKIMYAQRNYASSLLKARITTIVNNFPSAHLTNAIFVNSTEERDDTGLLLFSFYLRKRGIEIINIGSYHSKTEINQIIDIVQPGLFIISCDDQKKLNDVLLLVSHLSLNYKKLIIGLGGEAVTAMKSPEKERFSAYIYGQTINQWETWLLDRMVL
jgi:MerR family transcriptional regulator, light-induced transcriptional regulator